MARELGFEAMNQIHYQRNMYCGLYSDSLFTIVPNGDVYKYWDFVNDENHRLGKIGDHG